MASHAEHCARRKITLGDRHEILPRAIIGTVARNAIADGIQERRRAFETEQMARQVERRRLAAGRHASSSFQLTGSSQRTVTKTPPAKLASSGRRRWWKTSTRRVPESRPPCPRPLNRSAISGMRAGGA
jgi:hypothetical protein